MDHGQQSREKMLRWIDEAVADWFGMTVAELHQRKRDRAGVVPRQIASYLMKQIAGASLAQIGSHFGGQHESTIRHSLLRVECLRRTVPGAELTVCGLSENLKLKMSDSACPKLEAGRKVLLMVRQKVIAADPILKRAGLISESDMYKCHSSRPEIILWAFQNVSARRRTYTQQH